MKTATHRVLEAMKPILEDFHLDAEKALAALRPLYRDDVAFQDPLQKLQGWDAFAEMNRRLFRRMRRLRFRVADLAGDDDQGFLIWSLEVDPRGFPGSYRFDGTTHLRLKEQKVAYQRDYWDLLGGVMGSLPVAPVYRRLVARLA
jgi:SnoaL-like protein